MPNNLAAVEQGATASEVGPTALVSPPCPGSPPADDATVPRAPASPRIQFASSHPCVYVRYE